jgi:peptidoglycan/xylan/chitin deacetylase (PgdA/CDA1 family)
MIEDHHKTFVPVDELKKHFTFLKSSGFKPLTVSQYLKHAAAHTLPKKPILLTFDDGYVDNERNLLPLLKEFDFSATIYILGDRSITKNTWDPDGDALLTPEAIRNLHASGRIEFGSHGWTHRHYSTLARTEVALELSKAKNELESFLGCAVTSVAYPYGDAHDPQIRKIAEQSGYRLGFSTDHGAMTIGDDPFYIFRVNMFPKESAFSLWKKSRLWYRRYYAWRRCQKSKKACQERSNGNTL